MKCAEEKGVRWRRKARHLAQINPCNTEMHSVGMSFGPREVGKKTRRGEIHSTREVKYGYVSRLRVFRLPRAELVEENVTAAVLIHLVKRRGWVVEPQWIRGRDQLVLRQSTVVAVIRGRKDVP